MENLHVDIEDKNISNGYCEIKEKIARQNYKKVMPEMVEAGDGTHVDDIVPENDLSDSPVAGDLGLNETFHISSKDCEEVFKDPKAFDFLQQLGNTPSSRDLRKISLYRKFDPLVVSSPELPSQSELIQDVKPREKNESGEYLLVDTSSDEPPPEILQNISRKELSVSYSSVPNSPEALASPTTEILESPRNTVQRLCVEISTSNVSSHSHDLFRESPKAQSHLRRQSTSQSYFTAKMKRINDVQGLNDFEDTVMAKYNRGHDTNEKIREEVVILREILTKQENIYREDLNALEEEVFNAHAEVEELKKELIDQKDGNNNLKIIMEEYEKTVTELVSEKEKDKERYDAEAQMLMKEVEQLKHHLDQQEKSFSDLYVKYENSKTTLKQHEERAKVHSEEVERYRVAIQKTERNYEILKEHAEEKLERANQELTAMKQNHQVEISKLRAAIRKYELKLCSLEETILQKANENCQLTKLCDELINKVGMDDDNEDENFH